MHDLITGRSVTGATHMLKTNERGLYWGISCQDWPSGMLFVERFIMKCVERFCESWITVIWDMGYLSSQDWRVSRWLAVREWLITNQNNLKVTWPKYITVGSQSMAYIIMLTYYSSCSLLEEYPESVCIKCIQVLLTCFCTDHHVQRWWCQNLI